MSEYAPSPCFYCAHYDRAKRMGHSCRAYPDGIPTEFMTVADRHLAVRGDEAEPVAFTRRADLLPAEERLLEASLAIDLEGAVPRGA